MGAKFGPAGNSQSFYAEGHKSTHEAPRWLSNLSLDAYEYSAGNGITGSLDTFRKIGEEARLHNILLSFHTPYYISLSGVEEEKRLKSVDYIKRSIEASEAMGADIIVIHAGSASKISREEAVRLAKLTLDKALSEIPDTKVRFGIETMGKINQLGTLYEVLDICTIDKRLCPVIDFGHLNARSLGEDIKGRDDYLRIFESISSMLGAEYLDRLHCHFSRIEWTKSGEKRHLTFDDSVYGPDFEPLIDVIAENGLSPRIICESAGTMAEDALTMKKYYLNKKGEIAI